MYIEHIFYSGAIAILIGMLFLRYAGRDSSWVIILCAWAPDIVLPIHDLFHNVAFLVLFSILLTLLLHSYGMILFDALFFSFIGYGVHVFEDALVFKTGYPFLWPLVRGETGIGVFPGAVSEGNYIGDVFGIANTQVLMTGLAFLMLALLIRTVVEGPTWIRYYMLEEHYNRIVTKTDATLAQRNIQSIVVQTEHKETNR
jgi:membrane-bound metal-dependent hydrolase YbcI (DUF457 family)